MTKRENLISLLKRKGYSEVPVQFDLCPSLYEEFTKRTSETNYEEYFGFPWRHISNLILADNDSKKFEQYYKKELKTGTNIDSWGVAHEPGSEAAKHMTRMVHPLAQIDSLEQLKEYPFPDYLNANNEVQKKQVMHVHSMGLASIGYMLLQLFHSVYKQPLYNA